MKKRIIIVTKALWIGGIETALVNLLKQFDYDRYDVTLLVLHAELNMQPQIDPRCRVLILDREITKSAELPYRYSHLYHLTENSSNPSRFHQMMMWAVHAIKWIENRLYILYVRDFLKGESFDTVIIYSDVVAETAIRAVKANRYLMFYHHGDMRHVYHDAVAYHKCDKIITVSEQQSEALRAFVPAVADKITVVQNMLDPYGIRAKANEPLNEAFDKKHFHIVTVGRVSKEKGMDLAVQACAILLHRGISDFHWWIIGDGPEMPQLQTLIAELHLESYITLTGMKGNPYPYIRAADLYVQPSRVESFGLTIMEALMLDKPVVATKTFGAAATITCPEYGVICDVSAESIAVAVEELYQNREKLHSLSNYHMAELAQGKNREEITKLESIL